ncbi:MAG TPA: RNA polymerase sigma factor, partial [Steroidobacteraceae bacterium]
QLDRPGAESFLKAYLFRVATNLAVDRLRQRGRQHLYEEDIPADELETGLEEPGRRALASEQLGALIAGLQELPHKCREAFLLYRIEGLSQQEIGVRLGVTERMVRNYITEALTYCRLRADGATPEEARKGARS